jgi:phosphoglycolate phosphatase-like HAD superfamily hydrolase
LLYLFWDIDGTLLTTARAGIFALEEACEEVLGERIDLATMRTAGLTDAEIAKLLADSRDQGDEATVGALLDAYARLLPERLGWRQGEVLPNVKANLDALSGRDDVVNMLLTGNIAGGAEAKLRHYGLWDYFGAGGAFSEYGSDRPSIARRARNLAAAHAGGTAPDGDRMVVIGDTPHDVSCGKVIGARTLAVATGPGYTLEELEACDPDIALAELPPPAEFAATVALKP